MGWPLCKVQVTVSMQAVAFAMNRLLRCDVCCLHVWLSTPCPGVQDSELQAPGAKPVAAVPGTTITVEVRRT